MGIISTLTENIADGHTAQIQEAHEQEVNGLTETVNLLESQLTQLEQALLEPGWQRLSAVADLEFTREGFATISRLCRIMGIKNPLLRRAIAVKTYYVFGQGVEVSAKDDTVAPVIDRLKKNRGNQATLFSQGAQAEIQRAKMTDSNLFFALFTSPRTGAVQVRDVPFDEIQRVVYNPQDRAEPWFYERAWSEVDQSGPMLSPTSNLRRELYPDIDYQPAQRPSTFGSLPVRWDSPVLHATSNKPRNWMFGVPELYPALDWARAHSEYLDDFRKLIKVLAKIAWSLTGVKGSQLERAKTQLANATAADANVGQAWVGDQGGGQLEPMMKSGGVSVEPKDSREFSLMVSAATDIPETMLKGDPSTGNLATATTLDRPTELAMEWDRRWYGEDIVDRICQYAIDQAVIAPQGPLRGVVGRDEYGRREVTLTGEASREIAIDWPPLQERSMEEIKNTLVGSANGLANLAGMPGAELLRVALTALDVDGVDEIVAAAEDQLQAEQDAAQEQGTEERGEMGEALRQLREAIVREPVAA